MTALPARILLNEQHGSHFFSDAGDSFGSLHSFSNEELLASKEKFFQVLGNKTLIVIPITGDLIYCIDQTTQEELVVGQIQIFNNPNNFEIQVSNPFDDEAINLIMIIIDGTSRNRMAFMERLDFQIPTGIARMTTIFKANSIELSIGQFQGREEAIHQINGKGCFYYVLAGAFEIQERLLHAKDGLALWDLAETEIEALSNNAVLLALDLNYI